MTSRLSRVSRSVASVDIEAWQTTSSRAKDVGHIFLIEKRQEAIMKISYEIFPGSNTIPCIQSSVKRICNESEFIPVAPD